MALTLDLLVSANVAAQDLTGENQPGHQVVSLTPAQLFAFGDEARDRGDFDTAEAAYRALTTNPDIELRNEARFRLAMMLADRLEQYREAAILFRAILDEQPDVSRVRVELARMHAMMGNLRDAERELRAAQAAGLPPQVERLVQFYAAALSSQKSVGGSFQLAFAPDTNINRATQSDTLGTIIGDFDLSEDAQAKSGIGLAIRGQAFFREGLEDGVTLLARINAYGRFYSDSQFDDYVLALQVGPEYRLGSDRLNLAATTTWRWFGQAPYSMGYGLTGNFRHPVGERARLTADASVIHTQDRLNDLRDTLRISASAGVDRAFSARFGGGLEINGSRQLARDPGYSTASGGANAYVFRELGRTTIVANAGYSHLEADRRLFLYPERRQDDRFDLGLSGTFRALQVEGFAPLARVSFEDNQSTVEIYDYQRVAFEFGITAAF